MVKICKDLDILSAKARPAVRKDVKTAKKLEESLRQYNLEVASGQRGGKLCAGMAADVIGENVAIICVLDEQGNALTMMNPVILQKEDPFEIMEKCVCHKGSRKARRYDRITVEYRTLRWSAKRIHLDGLTAVAVQHEIDHLHGILI